MELWVEEWNSDMWSASLLVDTHLILGILKKKKNGSLAQENESNFFAFKKRKWTQQKAQSVCLLGILAEIGDII